MNIQVNKYEVEGRVFEIPSLSFYSLRHKTKVRFVVPLLPSKFFFLRTVGENWM